MSASTETERGMHTSAIDPTMAVQPLGSMQGFLRHDNPEATARQLLASEPNEVWDYGPLKQRIDRHSVLSLPAYSRIIQRLINERLIDVAARRWVCRPELAAQFDATKAEVRTWFQDTESAPLSFAGGLKARIDALGERTNLAHAVLLQLLTDGVLVADGPVGSRLEECTLRLS